MGEATLSDTRLVIRESARDWSGTIHASDADRAVAALSADPITLEELEAAFARFARPIRGRRFLANLSHGLCDEPYDAGLIVIDLAARLIVVDSTYSSPGTRGVVPYHDGRCATDLRVKYHLAGDWLISSAPRGGAAWPKIGVGNGPGNRFGTSAGCSTAGPCWSSSRGRPSPPSPGATRSPPPLAQEGLTDQADRAPERPMPVMGVTPVRLTTRSSRSMPPGWSPRAKTWTAPARARSRSSGVTTSRGTCKTVANNGRSPASALLD